VLPKSEPEVKSKNDLYGDDVEAVDKEIIQNYVKTEENIDSNDKNNTDVVNKDEPFDGIELQVNTDELDLKIDSESATQNKEVLAPMPELSKWEVDDENVEKSKEPGEISSPEEEHDSGKVTSDVIKRAENAIFAKAINSLKPIEIKKISSERMKLYGDEQTKNAMNNIQITVPATDSETRSIEINEKKRRSSKTPPPRLSVKERLGGKVEDVRKPRETRVVHSTVERVKSRSKTPKKEQPYRRVMVEKERNRKQETSSRRESSKSDRRVVSENIRHGDKYRDSSPVQHKRKEFDKSSRDSKKNITNENIESRFRQDNDMPTDHKKQSTDRERKKSTLDEAHFEPDYDENLESDSEIKEETTKKRERSVSPKGPLEKKSKLENETIKLDLTNVKKKPESDSESSSESEDTSSSSSSDARKKKKKKKKTKKKKKRAASDSESESDSDSDDHKKKKKKRKHKKKSSKKKKKSKHK
jgi:hypothetical protein